VDRGVTLCSIIYPPYVDELLQRQETTRSLRSTDALRQAGCSKDTYWDS